MTTGQEHAIISPTRLAKTTDLGTRLQSVLRQQLRDHLSRVYPDDGVFEERLTFAAATDTFTIVGDSDCTDGIGNVLVLDEATEEGSAIAFENTVAIEYYVGLQMCERSAGIQINPRTGAPEYERIVEDIGVSGAPTSVVDLGGTIQFNINSVLEAGVDHSGRTVLVYLNTPARNATTEAVAIESLTSAYSAPNNTITTAGELGQSTVSTTASDYTVIVLGPTVRRNTDLRTVSGVAFLGIVTGGGSGSPPSAFNTDDQNVIDVSLSGFNAALDAFVQEVDVSVESSTKMGTGERAVMPTPVQRTAAVYYNGNIFVMGGQDAAAAEVNDNQAFNVAGNAWAARTAVPSQSNGGAAADGRVDARLAVVDNIIYYIGGVNGGTYTNLVQRYNADTDTWLTPAANLPAARAGGAVGVISGRIYYAGGYSAAGVGEDNCYEYNPLLNTWSEVAAIDSVGTLEVWQMAYAVLDDRLYIIGGQQNGGANVSTVMYYDPAVDAWAEAENIPRYDFTNNSGAQQGSVAAVVNNVLHVFGGSVSAAHTAAPQHLVYSHINDEWSIMDDPNWPGAAFLAGAADASGGIHLIGGLYYEADSTVGATVLGTHSAFDASQVYLADAPGIASVTGRKGGVADSLTMSVTNPLTGETIPDMPGGTRYHARATVLHGKIYVSGGISAGGTYLNTMDCFCPETNAWTALANLIAPRSHHNFIADEETNTLWLWHGYSAAATERDEFYKYEAMQNDWLLHHDTSSVFRARGAYGKVGRTLINVGGVDGTGAIVGDTLYFDINLAVYVSGPALNIDRSDAAMVIVPNSPMYDINTATPQDLGQSGYKMLVCGGYDGANALDDIEMMDSRDGSWVAVTGALPEPRTEHAAIAWEDNTGARYLALVGGNNTSGNEDNIRLIYLDAPWEGNAGSITMTQGRNGPAVAAVDGFIYVIGGSDFPITTAYDNAEVYGVYRPRLELLENYSVQSRDYTNVQALKHSKRDNVAFRRGDIWGIGTWNPITRLDFVRIGETP